MLWPLTFLQRMCNWVLSLKSLWVLPYLCFFSSSVSLMTPNDRSLNMNLQEDTCIWNIWYRAETIFDFSNNSPVISVQQKGSCYFTWDHSYHDCFDVITLNGALRGAYFSLTVSTHACIHGSFLILLSFIEDKCLDLVCQCWRGSQFSAGMLSIRVGVRLSQGSCSPCAHLPLDLSVRWTLAPH